MVLTKRIQWRKLKGGTVEGTNEEYDFVISREGEGIILDVFEVAKCSELWRETCDDDRQNGRFEWRQSLGSSR